MQGFLKNITAKVPFMAGGLMTKPNLLLPHALYVSLIMVCNFILNQIRVVAMIF